MYTKNIMLVDDDEAAHIYHKIMIKEAGYDVEKVQAFFSVNDAMNALKEIETNENASSNWPDFIFIDLNMPIKTGYDFVEEFRTFPFQLKTPDIYFVSSTKNPNDIQKVESIDLIKGFETKFLEIDFFENLVG